MTGDVLLESESLRVTVRPRVGGSITAIEHKQLGLSVLGTVPWEPLDTPLESAAAPDEQAWLARYTGGWPLLFPNGGNACTVDGVFHGFHGEASIARWNAEVRDASVILDRSFVTIPVRMRREISLDGDLLSIRETAESLHAEPLAVMWGHHPTFGSDLLAGGFELETGARSVKVDEDYDPPANPLLAGATGHWPMVQGKIGAVDLRRPMGHGAGERMASLAYLYDFESPWVSLRRLDNAIGAALSWDGVMFPFAWIWIEIGGTPDVPWSGRARLIGLEPNSTELAYGLAEARRQGARLLTLQPKTALTASIRLHVFKPPGPVDSVDANGRACFR